jgi:hypothetical protein
MTRNRTAIDLLSALGTELTVLFLIVLATGLTISQYFAVARGRMHHAEVKLHRRAARRNHRAAA